MTVRFAAGNNRGGVLSTSGGGVRTELDPSVALTIDASSSGGNVDADLPVTIQGRVQNDGPGGRRRRSAWGRRRCAAISTAAGRCCACARAAAACG